MDHERLGSFLSTLRNSALGVILGWIIPWIAFKLLGKIIKSRSDQMLEGKELDLAIGKYGHASVDINDKLEVEVAIALKVDIRAELHILAAKTGTTLDDAFLSVLDKLLPPVV